MDRFDICEAYYLLEVYYNKGGWLRERPSNQRRMEATHIQLHRIGFTPGMGLGYSSLSPAARGLYHTLEVRYGFEESKPEDYAK